MNHVIKEELLRSIAVFFLAFIVILIIFASFDSNPFLLIVIILSIFVTIIHFNIKVHKRKNETTKPIRRKPTKEYYLKSFLFVSIFFNIIALWKFFYFGISYDTMMNFFASMIITIVVFIIYVIVKVRKKK